MEFDTDEFYRRLRREFPDLAAEYDGGLRNPLDGGDYTLEPEESSSFLSRVLSEGAEREMMIYREDVRDDGPVGRIQAHRSSGTAELSVTELGLELELSDVLHKAYIEFLKKEDYQYTYTRTALKIH